MKKYKYQLKHNWITSLEIGRLEPMFLQEVTPNDTWSGSSVGIIRIDPLDYPTFMSMKIYAHLFYVPYSQVWDEFPEVFAGTDTTTPWPTVNYDITSYNILNKLGCFRNSSESAGTPAVNALPLRVLNHIYNTYFRNPDTTSEYDLDSVSTIRRVNFPSTDYFGGITSEIQQGSEATIDTSGATVGATEIRDTLNAQRLKERRAQYGDRFFDVLEQDFGAKQTSLALDRPEHVARASTTLGVSEVVSTAEGTTSDIGSYKGHGIAGIRLTCPKVNFKEPGILMGVMCARPRIQLKKRMERIFEHKTRDELYYPHLANDTQQVVYNKEVYGGSTSDLANFGYQAKYEHLRTARDTIALPDSVDAATAHVDLDAVPTVAYLQQVQDYDHIFQDQTSTRLSMMTYFSHKIGKESVIKPRKK